jgi:CBS domain-containing protein/ribosome-associated translation inhibitor RaiA
MNIADIADQEYLSVETRDRVAEVRGTFESENPKGVIVTEDGEYAGVLTERTLLQSHVIDDTHVEKLVKSAPRVSRTEDVRDVARMLVEGGTTVAPVFEGDRLWGVVTADAILEAVLENLDALTVGDIASESVVAIDEDATVGEAIHRLREHGVSRLPVLNENGYLVGIVTTHDLVDLVVRDMDKSTTGERSGDLERMLDLPVGDEMSSPVQTTTSEDSVRDAVATMLESNINGLIVTQADDDRVVTGVLTKTDALRALSYTEESHLDVQITNIDLLDGISRDAVREAITEVADKYSRMQVRHAHVRFHEHKERLRGVPLLQCQIRLRTNRGQMAGSGEGYGADNAFHVALDTLERNVLEHKGVQADEEYRGQLLRKLGEL